MPTSLEYASFLIRLWREFSAESSAPPVGWHSEVEHIQTGERWSFSTLNDLLAFLRQEAERAPGRARAQGDSPSPGGT